MSTKVVNGVRQPLSQAEIDQINQDAANYKAPIPSVDRAQLKLALIELNHYDDLIAFIQTLTAAQKQKVLIDWNDRAVILRYSGRIVQVMEAAGMTDQQIDDVFNLAATL